MARGQAAENYGNDGGNGGGDYRQTLTDAEQMRHETDRRFRAAVEAFTDALWTNDAHGRMTGEQPGWTGLTGQSRDDYEGYGWTTAVHPEDAQPTLDAWKQSVANRTPFVFEHRIKTCDGVWRRFAVRAIPVLNDDGSVREWVGVHRDITETTEARLQLARNAETFQTLVRDNPFGVYVVDHDFKLFQTSRGCEKIFAGIEPLLGRDFAEILRELWQEPFASEAVMRFRETLSSGESYASERTVELRRGVEATEAYDWRIDRIVLPDGQFGVVCYFYDLSERVELETDLRHALDDKDLLLHEIDHRVRNSLSLVSSLLSMQGGASGSAEVTQALAVAAIRIQAIARVHERLYKGNRVGIIQFDEYLGQVCDDIQASLASDGMRVQLDTVALQLAVDHAVPLGLVTNELVTNAFKHCGGDDISISVSLAQAADGYLLTIEDDGAGMPASFVAGTGDGLGMKVVNLLTRQLGGHIDFPKPGQPACFKLSIPSHIVVQPVIQ